MKKERIWYFMPFGLGLVASVPLFLWGVPFGGDTAHHFRMMMNFYKAFLEGDVYPGWMADVNFGYGDPSSRFYPPLLYFLFSFFQVLFKNRFYTVVFLFSLINVLSAYGVFFWVKRLLSHHLEEEKKALFSCFSAFCYLFSPFYANQLYEASQYSQFLSSALLAYVFYFIDRTIEEKNVGCVFGLAFFYFLILLSNAPLIVISSISFFIYALTKILLKKETKNKNLFSKENLLSKQRLVLIFLLFLGALTAWLSSSFYWLRAISEISYKIDGGRVGQGIYFDFSKQFLFSFNFIDSYMFWSLLWMNCLGFFSLFFSFPLILIIFYEKKFIKSLNKNFIFNLINEFDRFYNKFTLFVLILTSLFFSTKLSYFLWENIKTLENVQFPWRWVVIINLSGCVIAGLMLVEASAVWKTKFKSFVLITYGLIFIALSFTFSHIIREAVFLNNEKLLEATKDIEFSSSNKDFLPIWSNGSISNSFEDNQDGKYYVAFADNVAVAKSNSKDVKIQVLKWERREKILRVENSSPDEQTLKLRLLYYPYWKVKLESKEELKTFPEEKTGILEVNIPKQGLFYINIAFEESGLSLFSIILSVLGLVVALGLVNFYFFCQTNKKKINSFLVYN